MFRSSNSRQLMIFITIHHNSLVMSKSVTPDTKRENIVQRTLTTRDVNFTIIVVELFNVYVGYGGYT